MVLLFGDPSAQQSCSTIGVSPVFHRIHHKDNMDKLFAICAIGIAPTDNDLRKGGRVKIKKLIQSYPRKEGKSPSEEGRVVF